jgi:hypothetical protein
MGPLLGHVLIAFLGAAQQRPRRAMRCWPLWAAALLLCLLAVGFLAVAGFFALTDRVGPPAAAALVAACMLLLALLLGLTALALRRRPPPPPNPALAALLQQLGDKAGAQMQGMAPLLVLGAGLLGVAVGYSPTLRQFLRSLIEELLERNQGDD